MEYIQLKAFARQDGAILAVLWVLSFVCYLVGLSHPMLSTIAFGLMLLTPFALARLLRHYRDKVLSGVVSVRRGWLFSVLVFFYASLLLAIVQYVYFAFIDKGYMLAMFGQMVSEPAMQQQLQQMGMAESLQEAQQQLASIRPIDLVLNLLTGNILTGMVLALPIAVIMRRQSAKQA